MPAVPSCEIARLEPGNHLFWISRTDIEFRSFLGPFLRQGLDRNERVLCILDGQSTSNILKSLEDEGVGVDAALRQGQLQICEAPGTYLRDGVFDPERMVAHLCSEEECALRHGHGGLRVAAEMGWALRGTPGAERLPEYEARLNEFLEAGRCLALCQYDQRHFKPEILLDMLSTHPMAVIGIELCLNPYYFPASRMADDNLLETRMNRQIGNLLSQKRAEEALKRNEERIRMLSRQLLQAQETERRMISHELHDRIAQDFCGLKINLDTLLLDSMELTAKGREQVAEMVRAVHRSIGCVRDLAYDLHPPELENSDLVETIRCYCDNLGARTAMRIDFLDSGIHGVNLDFDTRLALYRLVQEALLNIHKHAEATQVLIHLCFAPPNVVLRIQDDGKGFDVTERFEAAVREKRMGLHIMRERVDMLQGKMSIESQPSSGTSILVKIPCMEGQDAFKEDHHDRG